MHFLDLPFYETGLVKKKPISETDLRITKDLLEKIKPHQVYAAGDLSDPHGTHRVCLDVVFKSLEQLKNKAWMKDCWLWLYRGAWQEWSIEDIDMAVPLSPDELLTKRKAIFSTVRKRQVLNLNQDQSPALPMPVELLKEALKSVLSA